MFKKKIMICLCLFLFIILSISFYNVNYELFTNKLETGTQCTNSTNCDECIHQTAGSNTLSGCLWNKTLTKCGSFNDPGYSNTC